MWIGLYYDFIHYHVTEEISLCNGMFKMIVKNYHTVNSQHIKQIKKKKKTPRLLLSSPYMYTYYKSYLINTITL